MIDSHYNRDNVFVVIRLFVSFSCATTLSLLTDRSVDRRRQLFVLLHLFVFYISRQRFGMQGTEEEYETCNSPRRIRVDCRLCGATSIAILLFACARAV